MQSLARAGVLLRTRAWRSASCSFSRVSSLSRSTCTRHHPCMYACVCVCMVQGRAELGRPGVREPTPPTHHAPHPARAHTHTHLDSDRELITLNLQLGYLAARGFKQRRRARLCCRVAVCARVRVSLCVFMSTCVWDVPMYATHSGRSDIRGSTRIR